MRPIHLILPILCVGALILGVTKADAKSPGHEGGGSKILKPLHDATEDRSNNYCLRMDDGNDNENENEDAVKTGCSGSGPDESLCGSSGEHSNGGSNGNHGGGGSCHTNEEEGNGPPSTPSTVPEPATSVLLGIGSMGILGLRRRFK